MAFHMHKMSGIVAATLLLGACADGNGLLTTAALTPADSQKAEAEKAAQRQKALACSSLAARIDQLKSDGTVGRLEEAASGKSTVVRVKREALALQAELNKAHADYRASCGVTLPAQAAATASPAAQATTAAASTAPAPVTTAAATSAAPAAKTTANTAPPSHSLVGPATP